MTNTIPSFNFDALVTFNTAIADIDGAIIKYHNHHYAKKPRDPQSTTFRRHHFLPQCYPNKARVFIEQIPDNPEFWETVEPFDGVVKAIKEMYGAGIDVRIVVPLREVGRLGFILDWIEKWFGERYWTRRVIASDDLTFLKAKFLIDAHPVPEESAKLLNISGVGVVW